MVKKPIKLRCKWCRKKDDSVIPFRPFCSDKCLESFAKDFSQKAYERKKRNLAKAEKEQRKKDKEAREKLKTLSDYEKEARRVFQKWIRERDKDLPCISCGNNNSPLYDSGHFLKAELYSGLIFNESNVHKQCRKCNFFLDGNELAYREGLMNRYGIDYVIELESLKSTHRDYKYTKDELIEIKKKYLQKLKEL